MKAKVKSWYRTASSTVKYVHKNPHEAFMFMACINVIALIGGIITATIPYVGFAFAAMYLATGAVTLYFLGAMIVKMVPEMWSAIREGVQEEKHAPTILRTAA